VLGKFRPRIYNRTEKEEHATVSADAKSSQSSNSQREWVFINGSISQNISNRSVFRSRTSVPEFAQWTKGSVHYSTESRLLLRCWFPISQAECQPSEIAKHRDDKYRAEKLQWWSRKMDRKDSEVKWKTECTYVHLYFGNDSFLGFIANADVYQR